MMPNLEQIYDAPFFQEWGPGHAKYVDSAEQISDALYDMFKPKRLIDLGCGCGVYAHHLSSKGVTVTAVDGVQPPAESSYAVPIHLQDLTVPFENPWGRF